jgi:glycosyltransferase involved in cell wall biosynthesis
MGAETNVPTVSAIIPNYNHARYLRKRIESVLGQTYRDFEVILMDDCSTDESRAIIEEYRNDARVRIEFNEENTGTPFKQWNKGVGLARGKYVWIAESDDYADARLLERLVSILDGQPNVMLAYCRSWQVSDDDTVDGYFDTYLDSLDRTRWSADFVMDGIEECKDYFLLCNTVPNASSVVFRKSAFEMQGGADERMRVCGDYKLWAGMALCGRIAFVAEPLNYFRHHEQNTHRTTRGLTPFLEHFYVVQWILARIGGDKQAQVQQSGTAPDELPPITNSREQFRECRALANDLERAILKRNPRRRLEIVRTFLLYRVSVDDREFAFYPPNRWRFFSSRCALYGYRFRRTSWKRRLLDLVHLIEGLIGGFGNRHWLGKKYAIVKEVLHVSPQPKS